MFYVYILFLKDAGHLYTGFTADLKRRLAEHKRGNVRSTRGKGPVKLIHYEAYEMETDARRREKFLKKSEGKALLKKQIRDTLVKYNIV